MTEAHLGCIALAAVWLTVAVMGGPWAGEAVMAAREASAALAELR